MAHLKFYKNALPGDTSGIELVSGLDELEIYVPDPCGITYAHNHNTVLDCPAAGEAILGIRCDPGWMATNVTIGLRRKSDGRVIYYDDYPNNPSLEGWVGFGSDIITNAGEMLSRSGGITLSAGKTIAKITDVNVVVYVSASGRPAHVGQNFNDHELVVSYTEAIKE